MIETYRMLGKQWEEELLREARRLQAGDAARDVARRRRARRLASFRGTCRALLTRLRAARPDPVSTAD